ncbi:MAG TPA: pentapeptide repeat-containing protein [Thermoanaerobaculia bacterium]
MPEDDLKENDLDQLRRENEKLRGWLDLFVKEHRILAWIVRRIVAGPLLAKSMEDWFSTATLSNPLPRKESAAVATSIVRRLVGVGIFAIIVFLVPNALLHKQNLLIEDQNQYFREQTKELRRQIDLQEEQGDLVRRKELLGAIYDGKAEGLSMRTRVEALKALVHLDNKLIDRGVLTDIRVNLRDLDLSCDEANPSSCANLNGAWLVRVDFSGANLRGASFKGAHLTDSSFVSADISGTDFTISSIEGALFREPLPVPMHIAISLARPSYKEGEKLIVLDEINDLARSLKINFKDRFEDIRRDSVLLEYGLERIRISNDLQAYINEITKAAKIDGAKLPLSNFEYHFSIDQHSRLPIGVAPYRSVEAIRQEINVFEKVDLIQLQANELFGLYQVDVDLTKNFKEEELICVKGGGMGKSGKSLKYYEMLTSPMKKEFLRNLCGKERKFRNRGGMIFEAR